MQQAPCGPLVARFDVRADHAERRGQNGRVIGETRDRR